MILYFLVEDDKKSKPYSLEELGSRRITSTTLVWKEGLSEWVKASDLPELESIIYSEPPPIPTKPKKDNLETNQSLRSVNLTDGNQKTEKGLNNAVKEGDNKKINPFAREIRNIIEVMRNNFRPRSHACARIFVPSLPWTSTASTPNLNSFSP